MTLKQLGCENSQEIFGQKRGCHFSPGHPTIAGGFGILQTWKGFFLLLNDPFLLGVRLCDFVTTRKTSIRLKLGGCLTPKR